MTKQEALEIIKEYLDVNYEHLTIKETEQLDEALDMAFDLLKEE